MCTFSQQDVADVAGVVSACMLLTGQEVRWVDRMTHGLSMACALDQRAALERAGSDANRLKVRRLVEEVRSSAASPEALGLGLGHMLLT